MVEQWARLISEDIWRALAETGVEDAADLAYLFTSEDEAREWAVLQQCAESCDNFVVAWSLVRRLVDEDKSVVDRILAVELARRKATPKAVPAVSAVVSRTEPAVKRRKAAITDSVTGLEGLNTILLPVLG
eukprot:s651_g2.t1